MDVYIEWTYVVNGLVILWTLEILFFLLNQIVSIKLLLLYAFFYNISVILLYVDIFGGFVFLYDLVISLILFRKLIYIYYPLYVFVYMSIISFMHYMIKDSLIFQGILLIRGLSLSAMFILSMIVIIFIYFYLNYCKNKIHRCFVEVVLHGNHCKGFIDNGNQVTYKGVPIIFMNDKYILEDYVDRIEIKVINNKQMIHIVQVKDIYIDKHVFHDVYIGVMHNCEYDCILNNQILGGLL